MHHSTLLYYTLTPEHTSSNNAKTHLSKATTSHTSTTQEYLNLKNKHTDQLIFYRIGEFYELFFDDAVQVAQQLSLTLTRRGKHRGSDVPMCGIPAHALNTYLSRLLKQNKKVALYEQKHDSESDIYVRYLKQIYTPGTLIDEMLLEQNINNFLASIYKINDKIGFAIVDLSTGEVMVQHILSNQIESLLEQWNPAEILLDHSVDTDLLKLKWHTKISQIHMSQDLTNFENTLKDLYIKDFHIIKQIVENLDTLEKLSMQALLQYIQITQSTHSVYLKHPKCLIDKTYLYIHQTAKDALELMCSSSGKKEAGLLALINQTLTSMGSRKMIQRLNAPFIDIAEIRKRHNFLAYFIEHTTQTKAIRESLKKVYDIERILVRIYTNQEKKMDYINILISMQGLLKAAQYLPSDFLEQFKNEISGIKEIESFLSKQINIDANNILNLTTHTDYYNLNAELNVITKDYTEIELSAQSDIGSTVKMKAVQGMDYILEVPLKLVSRVPYHYKLIQTLQNAKRYTHDDLIGLNFRFKHCQLNLAELEKHILIKIAAYLHSYKNILSKICDFAAELDIYMSFAFVSLEHGYTKPNMTTDKCLIIKKGCHPVLSGLNKNFIPNDCDLTNESSTMVITGPNMSGKSTYMKQLSHIIIMAQMGCFIPSSSGTLGITDAIYTRLGAYDDITENKSTFMCEMLEMSNIFMHATENSFLIIDEIGRGTTPEEGYAIARAMLIYLHVNLRARTIFATHFHALKHINEEIRMNPHYVYDIQFKCMRISKKDNLAIDYLYLLEDGVSDYSYGLAVAHKAGIPAQIIDMSIKYLGK